MYLLSMVFAIVVVGSPINRSLLIQSYPIQSYRLLLWDLDPVLLLPSLLLVMVLAFILAFSLSGISEPNFCRSSLDFLKGKADPTRMNFLLVMPFICSSTFFCFYVLHYLEESAGIPVGGVVFRNLFEEILLSSYAVFAEELAFRMLPVLFPVALLLLISTRGSGMRFRTVLLALFKPRLFIEVYDDGRVSVPPRGFVATLVVLSSMIFAYAHLASGSWGVGKVLTAFIAGLVLGFSAFYYGFESSILIHWFYNSYWPALALASEFLYPFGGVYAVAFYYTMISGAIMSILAPWVIHSGIMARV